MDRNQKFLKRLTDKELATVANVLQKLLIRDTEKLDIKKLAGYRDIYRVRIGNIRIIFLDTGDYTEVLEISRRNERTYKKF